MGTTVLRGMIPAGTRAGYPLAILTAMRKLKFGFPYTLWDGRRRTPQDVRPRLPQSIQYPPGMEPKATGGVVSNRRWEIYVGPTAPKSDTTMGDRIFGKIPSKDSTWHYDPNPTFWS